MVSIGLRFSNSDYAVCVLTGSRDAPVISYTNKVHFPKGYEGGELLKWLHQEMTELIAKYGCDAMGIKKAEGTVRRSNSLEARVQAEAIASLAAAESGCASVHRKMNSTVAKDLGLKGKAKYLQSDLDTSGLEGFDGLIDKIKEAALVAWSCL